MTARLLSEGITHIEDLPIDVFISILKNLPSMKAQEKLDGANLWVGFDEEGRFYTSREGKRNNAERRYSEEDWPKVGAFDQFRAAHLALEQKQNDLKLVMRPGDTVEVEVLYGAQPNSVMYGAENASYIAFLRGVNGTPDSMADNLSTMLNNQSVDVRFEAVDTSDGENIEMKQVNVTFRFTQPHQISQDKLQAADVSSELAKLESFLAAKSPLGMTNGELAGLSLNTVPKDKRPAAKEARAEVLAKIQTEFKLPIKQALLDKLVRQLRSGLSDPTNQNDIGIEGIVLRDPETGEQVKVVDKDIFTAVNTFNQAVRGEVQSALNTTDPDAPLEHRGGLTGELRIKIADALGNRELAKPSNMRKVLEPIKGNSPEEAIKNLAKSLNIDDFQMVKRKILALTAETARQLKEKLEFFKENRENYVLKLKNGKEMKLSDETVKKTLVSFAEARRNLTTLFDKIKETKTLAQLLALLYGSQAKSVHAKQEELPVVEALLQEKKGELDISTYDGLTLFELLNTYLATVFMAMVIYHTDDTLGMRRLRDRRNYLLKKHQNDMSPLNHWGYAIWKSSKPEVKKHLPEKTVKELAQVIKDIPKAWAKFLHMDFSFDRQVKIDWADHKKTLQRLIDLSGLRSERLNTVLDLSVRFGDLTLPEQQKLMRMLNTYAHRFVPRSSLFVRTKVIAKKLKDADEKMVTEGLLKSIAALAEDEGGGGGGGGEGGGGTPTAGPSLATSAAAIASNPVRLLDTRRRVEKRKRNPAVVDMTKKFSDPRKETKE